MRSCHAKTCLRDSADSPPGPDPGANRVVSPADLSRGQSRHSLRNRAGRLLWQGTWAVLFRTSPRIGHGWRRFLLRLFGAKIGKGARIYPRARIWAPWNLEMGGISCLSDDVDCYCVDRVTLGSHATVSQYSFLCTASHDYEQPGFPLVTAPITIRDHAWVAADVFIAPGVTIGEGAVVGARASVFSHVKPWTVAVGNPARFLKERTPQHPPP